MPSRAALFAVHLAVPRGTDLAEVHSALNYLYRWRVYGREFRHAAPSYEPRSVAAAEFSYATNDDHDDAVVLAVDTLPLPYPVHIVQAEQVIVRVHCAHHVIQWVLLDALLHGSVAAHKRGAGVDSPLSLGRGRSVGVRVLDELNWVDCSIAATASGSYIPDHVERLLFTRIPRATPLMPVTIIGTDAAPRTVVLTDHVSPHLHLKGGNAQSPVLLYAGSGMLQAARALVFDRFERRFGIDRAMKVATQRARESVPGNAAVSLARGRAAAEDNNARGAKKRLRESDLATPNAKRQYRAFDVTMAHGQSVPAVALAYSEEHMMRWLIKGGTLHHVSDPVREYLGKRADAMTDAEDRARLRAALIV